MKTITVYTKDYCPYCTKAKRKLEAEGLVFEEVELTTAEAFEELKNRTGMMTVPQIFVGDTLIGGCDDLHAKIDEVKEMVKGG